MQEFIPFILSILQEYGYIIVFLGAIVGGEIFILASAFLASLGYFNIYLVIVISAAGIVISDSIWYFVGFKFRRLLIRFRKFFLSNWLKQSLFDQYFYDHYGKFLIMSKFLYGTRIATLVASGYKRVAYRKFLFFNLISITIWIFIVVILGYLMGYSWNYLEKYNSYARYFVIFGILLLFIIRLILNKFVIIKAKIKEYVPRN